MTLAELLNPGFDYSRSIADLARAMKFLLGSARPYRRQPRDGGSSFGPHETLIGYNGCRGCQGINWHSDRNPRAKDADATTWQENHDFLYRCVLQALLNKDFTGWRAKEGISLDTNLRFKPSYRNDAEKVAWARFTALHGYTLRASSLNPFHRRVNVLANPELVISQDAVTVICRVTQRRELRQSPRCYSRWDVAFLLRERGFKYQRWRSRQETFAAFIARAAESYEQAGQE
jgi:hypothetical protein